jgi:hypothetical protein
MLYEDYATTDPRILEKLSTLINTPSLISTESAGKRDESSIQSPSTQGRSFESGSCSISTSSTDSKSEGRPLCQRCSSVRCSYCAKIFPKKFLALCVNTGRFHNTLGEIDVTNICRDNQAFNMIKDRYLEVRGFRARARRLFLFRPNSVHFVKVSSFNKRRSFISWTDIHCAVECRRHIPR